MPCHALASESPREPYYIQIYSPLLYMLVFLCAGFLVRLIITCLLLTFILLFPPRPRHHHLARPPLCCDCVCNSDLQQFSL